MRRWPSRLAAALAAALVLASAASAAFATSAVSGPQTLASATLDPATGATVRRGTCVRNVSAAVNVSWTATASLFADGYQILRATASGGPYSVVGAVSGRTTTSFTDGGLAFSTAYWYAVRATRSAWLSVSSATASVTTPNSRCR